MNRGYAFGFLLIILVVVLGFYVAYTAFTSARETVRAQATETPATQIAAAPTSPPVLTATATLTATAVAAPLPGITATLTAAVLPTEPGATPGTAEGVTPEPTRPPTQPPVPPAGTPTAVPPTVEPTPAFQFRLAAPPGPDTSYPACCYLVGTVRSAAGVPLEGILVRAANEWITLDPAATKSGGEAGQYNIPIGFDVVRWDLVIVDAAGTQISTKVSIDFDPNAANAIRIDWERTY